MAECSISEELAAVSNAELFRICAEQHAPTALEVELVERLFRATNEIEDLENELAAVH